MLRALAFGDLAAESWGAVFSPGGGLPSFAVLGAQGRRVVPVTIEGDSTHAAEWWVTGDGLDIAVAPQTNGTGTSEDVGEPGSAGDQAGFDQLVTVRGEFAANGAREVELMGCRSERTEDLAAGSFQLIRDIRAWFSSGDGLAVLACRPRRASAHGDERLSATLFEGGQSLDVAEPRLSTTYADDGLPVRATLELWLPESEADETDEEAEHVASYPRRAAGQAAGPASDHDLGELTVQATPFRWRAAGRDGAGVYLLARPH